MTFMYPLSNYYSTIPMKTHDSGRINKFARKLGGARALLVLLLANT
jgi:hypothetical protein